MCGAKNPGKGATTAPAKRKYIIGGNWKCNGTVGSNETLINDTLKKLSYDENLTEVVVAPISIHIASAKAQLSGTKVNVAVQNMSLTGNGAYTGEVSAEQVKDFGIDWVIIGHSERRSIYGETDADVGVKVKRA